MKAYTVFVCTQTQKERLKLGIKIPKRLLAPLEQRLGRTRLRGAESGMSEKKRVDWMHVGHVFK